MSFESIKLTEQAKQIAQMLSTQNMMCVDQGVLTTNVDAYAKALEACGLNIDDANKYATHRMDFLAASAAVGTDVAHDYMVKNQEIGFVEGSIALAAGSSANFHWNRHEQRRVPGKDEMKNVYGPLTFSVTSHDSTRTGQLKRVSEYAMESGQKLFSETAQQLASA